MIAKNFTVIGQKSKTAYSFAFAAALVCLNLAADEIPMLAQLPNVFFTVLNALVATIGLHFFQTKQLGVHKMLGGETHSRGTVVMVNVIGISAYLLLGITYFAVSDWNGFMEVFERP